MRPGSTDTRPPRCVQNSKPARLKNSRSVPAIAFSTRSGRSCMGTTQGFGEHDIFDPPKTRSLLPRTIPSNALRNVDHNAELLFAGCSGALMVFGSTRLSCVSCRARAARTRQKHNQFSLMSGDGLLRRELTVLSGFLIHSNVQT
jgi:hypothetical protein